MRLKSPCSGSLSLRLGVPALAACRDSQSSFYKGTRSPSSERLPLLGGARFQALFHSPLGVLFTFPSRYWFAIGHRRVFSPWRWSPCFGPGFALGPLWIARPQSRQPRTGLSPLRPAFPCRSARTWFSDGRGLGPRALRPQHLRGGPSRRRREFGLARFRSHFLARSRFNFSSSRVLRCFSSPVVPRGDGLHAVAAMTAAGFPHSGIRDRGPFAPPPGLSRLATPVDFIQGVAVRPWYLAPSRIPQERKGLGMVVHGICINRIKEIAFIRHEDAQAFPAARLQRKLLCACLS